MTKGFDDDVRWRRFDGDSRRRVLTIRPHARRDDGRQCAQHTAAHSDAVQVRIKSEELSAERPWAPYLPSR
jgi:hypothetical protein